MHNVEELERALDYPWDNWAVFLHPAQRELVERDFNGPARVSGTAVASADDMRGLLADASTAIGGHRFGLRFLESAASSPKRRSAAAPVALSSRTHDARLLLRKVGRVPERVTGFGFLSWAFGVGDSGRQPIRFDDRSAHRLFGKFLSAPRPRGHQWSPFPSTPGGSWSLVASPRFSGVVVTFGGARSHLPHRPGAQRLYEGSPVPPCR